MRVLLTSSGITNSSIHDAPVDLLDKPIADSTALFIPTGVSLPRRSRHGVAGALRPGFIALVSIGMEIDGDPGADGAAEHRGCGLGVDFAVIPHLEHPHHPDASLANAEKWAARIPAPTYAIDDESAISVVDGVVDGVVQVVSEGQRKLFQP